MRGELSVVAVIAVVGVAAADRATRRLVVEIYEPGPELHPLLGALVAGHHHVLEEDGPVAVSPGDAGVVTDGPGGLGVLGVGSEMRGEEMD